MIDRVLPHDQEAENDIISACIGSDDLLGEYASLIPVQHFYGTRHRIIFEVLQDLRAKANPTELSALVAELRSRGQLDACGGAAALGGIYQCPPAVSPEFYAEKLRQYYIRRQMAKIGNAFDKAAFATDGPADLDLERLRGLVAEIDAGASGRDTYAKLSALVAEAGDRYDALNCNPGKVAGISTGFTDLDRQIGGLFKSDMVILAARPSMGKTALAANIATNAAGDGLPVGIFSLEMSKAQVTDRFTSALSGVNLLKFRVGGFTKDDYEAILMVHEKLHALPIVIDDEGGLHVNEIRRRARRMKVKQGVELVVVDYIGLAAGDKQNNRTEEVSSISRGLKALAKELDVCVLALSQVNRQCEQRTDRRPLLSDLRDSGALEQDADVVAFIYRDEVYNDAIGNPARGTAEIIIAKQRNGPVGTLALSFHAKTARFGNLARGGYVS